jgi:hypothetical protein
MRGDPLVRQLSIPRDLAAFLRANRSFDYDASDCEAGLVTLLPLDALRLHLFPMDCQSTPVADHDPNRRSLGCYLVSAVSLLASAEDYDPDGLLLWLPRERRYGTWDSSHDVISLYPRDTKWADIATDPAKYINACWGNWDGMMECLKPWPNYRHYFDQIHEPIIPVLVEPHERFRVLSYQAIYHEQDDQVIGKVVGFADLARPGPDIGSVRRSLRDALAATVAEYRTQERPLAEPRLATPDDGPCDEREMMPVALEPRRRA